MAVTNGLTLVSSSTLTATGAGSAVALPANAKKAVLYVTVGTVTGTVPSMTVKLQGSIDGTNDWVDYITGSAISTSSVVQTTIDTAADYAIPLLPYIRASYTITGTTPSFATTVIKAYIE